MINNVVNNLNLSAFDKCNHGDKSLNANTAIEIISAKAERKYAAFINNSVVEITLVLGEATKAVIDKGSILKPGGSYEINSNNLYLGAVSAIAKVGCKLIFIEGI